jgi:CheY-like chemotaxis protein
MDSVLQRFGYTIIKASNYKKAIQQYRGIRGTIQLLLDVIIPRKNRREAYDEIREKRKKKKGSVFAGDVSEIL